jgi:hypothetical protein
MHKLHGTHAENGTFSVIQGQNFQPADFKEVIYHWTLV